MCFQVIIVTPRNSEIFTSVVVVLRASDINDIMGDCATISESDKGTSLLTIPSFSDEKGDT